MGSSRLAKGAILALIVAQICAFDFLRREYGSVAVAQTDGEVQKLQSEYKSQLESLKLVETSIQTISDEALAILPEWLGTLEGRDQGTKVTKADIKEFCDGLKGRLKSPGRCQPYLMRRLDQERDDINRLWQSRKADLQVNQMKYRTLKQNLNKTVESLQKLGAQITE